MLVSVTRSNFDAWGDLLRLIVGLIVRLIVGLIVGLIVDSRISLSSILIATEVAWWLTLARGALETT